jgi:hypothetical protein
MAREISKKNEIDKLIATYEELEEKLEKIASGPELDPQTFKKLSILRDNSSIMAALSLNPRLPANS